MENQWQPIETAPKDGSIFIALIGNAIYAGYYSDGGTFCWIMHRNIAGGRIYQKKIIDGVEYQKEIQSEKEPDYQANSFMFIKGFEYKPTHWMPLPKPPVINN